MSWKSILREWTEKLHCCPHRGNPHIIYHISKVPKDVKLKPMPCHLGVHPRDMVAEDM